MKADDIINAVQGVTKKWAKQRKREEREASAQSNRRWAMTRYRHVSIRDAAWRIMKDAYGKASAGGALPAHARQIMYAARGYIQKTADRPLGKDFDKYFTQTLLPDYIEEKGVSWNVVFDARGHFTEPHTGREVPLGTLQVRNYLHDVDGHEVGELDLNVGEKYFPTMGPKHRFGAVLFIEKEGFMPLFAEVKLAERYDIALMSTKGMSSTAARELVDDLCSDHHIPLLLLHDFDKEGFSIAGTLRRDTRRYMFLGNVEVIDLGLRLDDIGGLETEQVFSRDSADARAANLHANGATTEEIEFLLNNRVELNAMASDQLVAFIERKLAEHGVKKIIPDAETLAEAYRRMRRQAAVQAQIDEVLAEMEEEDEDDTASVPPDLSNRIEEAQRRDPALRWDGVLRQIAGSQS